MDNHKIVVSHNAYLFLYLFDWDVMSGDVLTLHIKILNGDLIATVTTFPVGFILSVPPDFAASLQTSISMCSALTSIVAYTSGSASRKVWMRRQVVRVARGVIFKKLILHDSFMIGVFETNIGDL
jgi:hypothetical protein